VYIDGSAGSLILQMLAAGLFALGATLRVVRESVKTLLSRTTWPT
jgi:hypothetical protein